MSSEANSQNSETKIDSLNKRIIDLEFEVSLLKQRNIVLETENNQLKKRKREVIGVEEGKESDHRPHMKSKLEELRKNCKAMQAEVNTLEEVSKLITNKYERGVAEQAVKKAREEIDEKCRIQLVGIAQEMGKE